ncbi:MAG: family 43 glycosylhydrolase [Acidobacteria bacterium]|nr:family 43 glycosylhydrolase [Acidobacteriota bacterium]
MALFAALMLPIAATAPDEATYSNPVLAGDFPDPSVIRVGDEYWATTTSSEWAPHFPLLRSRDLVNWQLAGHVFPSGPPRWSAGNYWAPEMARHSGRFLIYYTARQRGGPLCVAVASSDQPGGPYLDHGPLVCQEMGSMGGAPVNDENGRLYLLWKEDGNRRNKPTPIWAQPLDSSGTRLVGSKKRLIRNDAPWERNLVEAPFVVRRNGWFYLFYSGNACCGQQCSYALGVARSRRLLGSWKKNPANPILAGNGAWKCPGHGSVVTDAGGRDFLLYHAYRADDFNYVGRQGLLDQITWTAGWPVINRGQGPSARAAFPLGAAQQKPGFLFDDFSAEGLREGWQWPIENRPNVSLGGRREPGLILSPLSSVATDVLGAVLARGPSTGDYVATTLVDTPGLAYGAVAGLAAYGDSGNAAGVAYGGGKITVWKRFRKQHVILESLDFPGTGELRLRMTARAGHRFQFAVSRDGVTWQAVGEELEGDYLPPWDRGVRIALTCGGAQGASARFRWFWLSPRGEADTAEPLGSR